MANDMTDFDRQEAARDHLTRRFAPELVRQGPGLVLSDLDALLRVHRVAQGRRGAELDVDDVRAALALLSAGREVLEILELRLLAAARQGAVPGYRGAGPPLPFRSWLTWEEIAQALGLESRQAAEQRYGRLLARYPGITLPAAAATAPRPHSTGE
jgi:hypothetical protein